VTADTEDRAKLRDEMRAAWTKADVRPLYWKMALTQFGPTGADLRSYLQHGDYREDRLGGTGIYISGKARDRHLVLPTLAKELVMLQDRVQYVSLRKLTYVVQQGGEDYELLLRTSALCIGQFYDDTVACPYQGYELSNVEDFLRSRMESNQRLYLSATSPAHEARWFAEEFRAMVAACTVEYRFAH
jgi:hypothetical protein